MAALIRWRQGCSLGRQPRLPQVDRGDELHLPSDRLGARNRSSSCSVPAGGEGTKTRCVTRTIP
jgi:hypothetical protein